MYYPRLKPNFITYDSYKNFKIKRLMEDLNNETFSQSSFFSKDGLYIFSSLYCMELNMHLLHESICLLIISFSSMLKLIGQ